MYYRHFHIKQSKYVLLFLQAILYSFVSKAQTVNPVKALSASKSKPPLVHENFIPDTLEIYGTRNFRHFSVKDGLAQTQISEIFIDSRNLMWIATYGGGVSVFDGITFRTLNKKHGLSNDNAWDFIEDEKGRVWIATDKGVSIFDGKDFAYINEKDSLTNPYVWALCKDTKGRIWMGTAGGGVYVYENGKITNYKKREGELPVDQVTDIAEDRYGNIWMGTYNGGVVKYNGKVFQTFASETQARNIVRNVSPDHTGRIWCGTEGGVLVIENDSVFLPGNEHGLPGSGIRDIYPETSGDTWITTSAGIYKYNGVRTEAITKNEGLIDNKATAICKDRWGTIWFGTSKNGLAQLISSPFLHYTTKNGFPSANPFFVYHDSKKNLWIATEDKGMLKYDGRQFYHFNPANGFKWKTVTCFFEDKDGNIWFGTGSEGIVKYDGNRFYQYTKNEGLSNNRIFSINQDKNGDLWICTQWSVNRFDGKHFYLYNENSGFSHYIVLSSYKDRDNNLWFGTYGGATFYDGINFTNFNASHGLSNNANFSILTDSYNNAWIACYGEGICIVKNGWQNAKDSLVLKKLSITNLLEDDAVTFVKADKEGNFWIGSNKGISKVEIKGKNIFESDPVITHFGYNDGFTGVECRLNGFAEDSERSLWIPSSGMVSRFWPKKMKKNEIPPVVRLKALKLGLKEINWTELEGVIFSGLNKWNNVPENPEFDYYNNHLQFEFTGITFDRPEAVEYQWKLNGFDPSWSPWSKKTEATYSNISPGNYTFILRARNADNAVSEDFIYSFVIHKPFWETSWFRISGFVLVVVLIIFTFRIRTRTLRKRQQVLEQTVTERTEEVVKQKHLVEEKQKEIIDSINYAKRIQSAILAPESEIKKYFPESFLLYLPKDIVAGDFYFFEVIENASHQPETIFIAAADCTGHGVPAALVSVVCSNALSRSVKEFNLTDPGEILGKTRELVLETFRKSGQDVKDGMDISLCCFKFDVLSLMLNTSEPKTSLPSEGKSAKEGTLKLKTVYWAGANNPLWVIRKDIIPLHEVSEFQPYEEHTPYLVEELPDKQPIGFTEVPKPFRSHEIFPMPGDIVYLFTDGYADQFGGPKGKKFKYSNLEKLLKEVYDLPMEIQKEKLLAEFNTWKGELEQVDDVCMIGIKL